MAATGLAIASMGLTAFSTINQYQGQRRQARSLQAQGRGAQELANAEAGFLDAQAGDAIERGQQEEQRHRSAVSKLKGSQRARLAAQGIDINSGSAADLQMETEILGEIDARTIRSNARREAWGFTTQADLVRRGGSNMAAGYRNEAASVRNQSFGTLLTGAARIGDTYASGRRTVPTSTNLRERARAIPVSNTPHGGNVRPGLTVPAAKPWWQP